MDKIKTFSLSGHSQLFAVPESGRDYLFVQAINHPFLEEPYRAESYAIALIKEGQINLQVGLTHYQVKAPAIISMSPSLIRSFSKAAEPMKMDILFFKDSFLLERHPDLFFLMKYDFFENSEFSVVSLLGAMESKVSRIFELINISQGTSSHHLAEIIRSYIFILIYELDGYHRYRQLAHKGTDQIYPIFAQFKKLLTKHYINERKLDFYAHHLHITPKYLSAVIKKETGKTAAKWIDESITLEAKVLLQKLRLTISQISNQLNFPDQSSFGKFFKSNTGLSPMEYRKKF